MKLLDFVALYGLILIPMGGVIFADFYLLKKWNLHDYYAEKAKINFNWAAGLTWFSLLALALMANFWMGIELYFLPLPVWILSVVFFVVLSKLYQKKIVL
jgi:cytosine/uracil/thiamine/allantoin permease